ncbi:PQQ-binding-like beta-propeller repeat protein [Flavicella marina]|uniref:hypothetical protein n=1 Tax=Flavicella marina TaxID=1475951 RepID=UPI0012641D27|nr:hypothetical protein [Flavicella marina]
MICVIGKRIHLFTVLLLLLGFYTETKAQEDDVDLASQLFDFEENGLGWAKDTSSVFSILNEKSLNGEYALKFSVNENQVFEAGPLYSIETEHTIHKVRTATFDNTLKIIASSYEGIVMSVDFNGAIHWKNKLSGFMVNDIWCEDITGDGNDEILIANADGKIYCLDSSGEILWEYQQNEVPMYAITVVKKNDIPYVVGGSLDLNVYYLSANGSLTKTLKSSTYSQEKTWGETEAKDYVHYANFLKAVPKDATNDYLLIQASNNIMQDKGATYMFDVLEDTPIKRIETQGTSPVGELRFSDHDNDSKLEVLLGFSNHQKSANLTRLNLVDDSLELYPVAGLGFGYSVMQAELITDISTPKYMLLVGNQMVLVNPDLDSGSQEKLITNYSYYDVWKKPNSSQLIFASCQSGGSQVHILDTGMSGWKEAYQNLVPKGKIQKIIENTAASRAHLAGYTKPVEQREARAIYFMTENTDSGVAKTTYDYIRNNYSTPMFLGGGHMNEAENWDRSAMENEKYKNKRDSRRNYIYTQQEAVDHITNWYGVSPDGDEGIAYWGGHGNDPYMFHLSTTKLVLDAANNKKTVLIYPELEDHSEDFAWVMEDLFYPLASYAQNKNGTIYVRTKHNFWQGNVYLPMWDRLRSGEFADVFVPSMEETSDKAMDISVASRVGIWASGAVHDWGTRTVPDNPSFDRSRQFCHQKLPNHFLRHLIYHMANGATYLNNFAIDPDYMSIVWELTAKGALFVPKPNELLSISPVHISMFDPDDDFMLEASSLKWATHYDEEFIENNPFVFSRQNANWGGAQVTDWDFSKYAGHVKDRRQNYLPSYPNGLVLITPPQAGAHAVPDAARGELKDNLHPIYQNILTEYYTDGRYYYSADGNQRYNADEYYTTIENEIETKKDLLPLTVSGNVAWVTAQISPTKLRLTLIDGEYLNPDDREVIVDFNSVTPVGMSDILDGTSYNISNPNAVEVEVPCGGFRFIDITLAQPLN